MGLPPAKESASERLTYRSKNLVRFRDRVRVRVRVRVSSKRLPPRDARARLVSKRSVQGGAWQVHGRRMVGAWYE